MDGLSSKTRNRRSFPTLETLHITPLTHEPLGQSSMLLDDDGDYDNDSSTGIRRSYLHSRSLPQTPSILSRSSSRSNSRTRRSHRSTKSFVGLTGLDDDALYPRTPGGGSSSRKPKSAFASGRQTPARVRIVNGESTEFLLRTASLLVENASEGKGQGWISKRNSSTSLTNYEMPESAYPADDEFSGQGSRNRSLRASRRNSVIASAPGSRWGSRRGSRIGLSRLTPGDTESRDGYFEDMGLDFDGEEDWDGEEEEDTIDDGELRRLLKTRVGWIFEDIFGGWFDFRGEDDEGSDNDDPPDAPEDAAAIEAKSKARREKRQRFAGITKDDLIDVQPPAPRAGPFGDARWLLGLARSVLV